MGAPLSSESCTMQHALPQAQLTQVKEHDQALTPKEALD